MGAVPVTISGTLNRGRLARDLTRSLDGEARFDEGSRALYANDASIYRELPLGVVLPRHADDVFATLAICRTHGVPIAARGCGTGLAGQSTTTGVLIDFSKYMRKIVHIDPERRIARVQPGVVCDQLRAAAGEHGLTFAVDPATHDRNTVGGMIGNNSCGTHSYWGGKTVDNVIEMDVVTYDGTRMTVGRTDDATYERILAEGGRRAEIHRRLRLLRDTHAGLIRDRFPEIPRRVSGYNLPDLLPEKGFDVARALVGSESTCALVLEATVRLLPDPTYHALLVVGYPDPFTAADHVPDFDGTGAIALESFDAGVLDNLEAHKAHIPGMDELPTGAAWLLVEYGADTREEAEAQVEHAKSRTGGTPGAPKVFADAAGQAQVWEVRRSTIEFTRIPGRHAGLAGWEDAAVAPERLGDYLREYCRLVERHGYHTVLFGHYGQGCVHNRLDLHLDSAPDVENFRRFLGEAGDLVVRFGGSLSGEHGDGQLRADQLVKMFGPKLVEVFAEFKAIFDPDGRMNPGKIVHPYPPTANLGLGTGYQPREVHTHFRFPDDQLGFADAVNRCFGIGRCRHDSGGTMCPSYMVTHEEEHSTRGRARLLLEMMGGHLSGSGRGSGWRDEHVKDALDLCLACKGCKGDCPVGVDMATYKAEFLSHYYARRLRPAAAYAMGLIPIWARLASRVPRLANAALAAPGLGRMTRKIAGVDPRREAPPFAARTFRSWFAEHAPRPSGPEVLLWPDTFTNHFTPEVGIAAVEVLESAGYVVRIPATALCCGRPLYDFGMLPTAKRWMRQILRELHEPIARGVPVVGLEPSCLAVFRDELTNLFPADADARRLSQQSVTLAELLDRTDGYTPPALHRTALVQMHCHQTATIGISADHELMRAMGLDLQLPDSGCCGMAGSFGYEAGEQYDVSMAAGERVILPAVRAAAPDTLVLADGFSCRSQIRHGAGRDTLHLAEVLAMAGRQVG
ncbi:FAD-binding and (Fe-S)-binding domain-containing protein [Pseudonocardia sp. MH-G8]|uniref:FAD-binding and (Fe-S)-binding domain-containing protein n=1 Tax=Pseudonocardia sp. MH-G8 TaxID=1854588 RepID=UPI000BA0183A|nr:FAD-binding and (Fe-S)-binding domain-containing protein [Pseudonocardia sp. MH-G8]OZM77225.1 FAD-binding oxidoreductase [Pseudonocardia sp. MH-G8]